MIERLDTEDGDPDVELNPDELDFSQCEDDLPADNSQPGGLHWCLPIGQCEDDEDDDPAGGNVEDEGELVSDGEDRGSGGYITYDEWQEIKRLGRLARRKVRQ
jgi:hypothetical protein